MSKPLLRMLPLGLLVGAALATPSLAADMTGEPANDSTELPAVRVTAASPTIRLDAPGTTSTIGRLQMDRHLVNTIRDLVRYEPGVSAIGSAGRFGLDSFNIRGLSGNRTYMEIDGVPMPYSFGADVAGGSFRAGRDFIDLDAVKRVEIIRGPASALYPSAALGGVVSLVTRDPADYLADDERVHVSWKERHDSADRSLSSTVTLAAGDKRNGLLLTLNHRDGHDMANQGNVGGIGATRTRPDPLDYRLDGLLGKYVHTAASGRSDRVTIGATRRHTRTDGLSERVPDNQGYIPDDYRSRDTATRLRASVGQHFPHLSSMLADTLEWHVYAQRSRTRTRTQTDTASVLRYYDNLPLEERRYGGKLVAGKRLNDGVGVTQTVSYGVELSRTHDRSRVDGYGVDKQTGATGKSAPYFLPGNYPLHLIPESDTDRYAVFGQDRIELLDGRLAFTPGVRVERYAYKPQADALYASYNPGYVQREYSDHHVSPKLGVVWHFNDVLGVYADYAGGFRAPLYNDISGAWNEQPVPGINIAYLPNPDLEAETSRNAEIGLRGHGAAGWFSVAAYYNRYRDFIWSGHAVPANEVPPWAGQIAPGAFLNMFFRSVNASRAYIKGAEASGRLRLDVFGDALRGWSLRGSAAIASGALVQPGDSGYSPLNTVDPARLVVGLGYDRANWGTELVGTAVRRHTRLGDPELFRPGGYATLDFYAHWTPVANVSLYLGVRNLADRKYWDWGNLNSGLLGNLINGNGVNDAGTGGLPADRLSMPGRSFSLSTKIDF